MSLANLTNNILTEVNTNGVVVANGTGAPTAVAGTAGQFLRRNTGNTAYEFVNGYTAAEIDAMIQGLDPKASVRVATTANITLSGTQTIDGVAVVAGDRVLVKDQGTPSQNGIYIVAAGAWSRSSDMDTASEFPGAYTFVEQGTVNVDRAYVCTSDNVTVGTTAINFVLFAGSGAYVPMTRNLTINGVTLDLSTDRSWTISLAGLGGEPSILAGTTTQYWRGDKTWQTLNTSVVPEGTNQYFTEARVRATPLTGYALGTNTPITATDTILSAFNNIQAQINARLTANQTITLSGDVTGSGTTAITTTLANSGVTAGTYNNVATEVRPFTVDAKGRVTSIGAAVTITPAWSSITSKPTTISGYGITDFYAQVVSGFVTGANSTVLNTDSLEVAIEKLQGQINNRLPLSGGTLTGALNITNANINLSNTYFLSGKLVAGTNIPLIGRNSSDKVSIDPDGYGTVLGGGLSGTSLSMSGSGTFGAVSSRTTVNGGSVSFTNTANSSGFDIGLLGGAADSASFIMQRANSTFGIGTNNTIRFTIAAAGEASFTHALQVGGEITAGSVSKAFLRQTVAGDVELGSKAGGIVSIWADNGAVLSILGNGAATFAGSNGFTIGSRSGFNRIQWDSNGFGFYSSSNAFSNVGAVNFHDANGTFNVNLGSGAGPVGGGEGRGLVAGYSGANYAGIGYNIRHTTTSSTWIAPGSDTVSYLEFTNGLTVRYAASGTVGRTLNTTSLAQVFRVDGPTGNAFIGGAANIGGVLKVQEGVAGTIGSTDSGVFDGGTLKVLNGHELGVLGSSSGNSGDVATLIFKSNKGNSTNGGYVEMQAYYAGGTYSTPIVMQRQGGPVLVGTATNDGVNRVQIAGTIKATKFTESSDRRIKTPITENILVGGVENIKAHLYLKDGLQEIGYYAQDVLPYIPSAVTKGADDVYTLEYRSVFAAKIASLENRVKVLEEELNKYKN